MNKSASAHLHDFWVALVLDDVHGILRNVHNGRLNLWLTKGLRCQSVSEACTMEGAFDALHVYELSSHMQLK